MESYYGGGKLFQIVSGYSPRRQIDLAREIEQCIEDIIDSRNLRDPALTQNTKTVSGNGHISWNVALEKLKFRVYWPHES